MGNRLDAPGVGGVVLLGRTPAPTCCQPEPQPCYGRPSCCEADTYEQLTFGDIRRLIHGDINLGTDEVLAEPCDCVGPEEGPRRKLDLHAAQPSSSVRVHCDPLQGGTLADAKRVLSTIDEDVDHRAGTETPTSASCWSVDTEQPVLNATVLDGAQEALRMLTMGPGYDLQFGGFVEVGTLSEPLDDRDDRLPEPLGDRFFVADPPHSDVEAEGEPAAAGSESSASAAVPDEGQADTGTPAANTVAAEAARHVAVPRPADDLPVCWPEPPAGRCTARQLTDEEPQAHQAPTEVPVAPEPSAAEPLDQLLPA
mmetsp:Transcript_112884/g.319323  ORF Transcript_112884/g.319323 Transcript_112884/m.319323 type:complete len:311 (-) Transcript_112884:7-939(-)